MLLIVHSIIYVNIRIHFFPKELNVQVVKKNIL